MSDEIKQAPDGKFLPGTKAGPGRPKGSISFTTLIKEKMKEIPIGQTRDWMSQIVDSLLESAVAGKDMRAIETLIAYVDGKPRQNIGLDGGAEGAPIIIAVETEDMAKKAIQAFLNQDAQAEDAPSETNE